MVRRGRCRWVPPLFPVSMGKLNSKSRLRKPGTVAVSCNGKEANGQNVHLPTRREIKDGTAGEIGKEVGVDGRTVRRNERFAKGVDAAFPFLVPTCGHGSPNRSRTVTASCRFCGMLQKGDHSLPLHLLQEGKGC